MNKAKFQWYLVGLIAFTMAGVYFAFDYGETIGKALAITNP